MSLRTALQLIGLLAVLWILLQGIAMMGPIGWVVFGAVLLIGSVQVWRNRRQRDRSGPVGPSVRNCPDCGAPNDPDRRVCTHCEFELEP